MEYRKEEEHIEQGSTAEIKTDFEHHFVSSGAEETDLTHLVMHSTNPSSPTPRNDESNELQQELKEMAEHRPDGDGEFVRGVAGLGFPYAEEEGDAE